MFDYTSYFVTVGLSNTVQLRLLGNYSVMLELLESLLCCLARYFVFLLLSFPDVIKTCYSTSVCQALRNQAYTNTLASLTWLSLFPLWISTAPLSPFLLLVEACERLGLEAYLLPTHRMGSICLLPSSPIAVPFCTAAVRLLLSSAS